MKYLHDRGLRAVLRVREDVVQGKRSAAPPKLSGCSYRSALRTAGAAVPGSAEIHMSIDDKGNVTTFVNATKTRSSRGARRRSSPG